MDMSRLLSSRGTGAGTRWARTIGDAGHIVADIGSAAQRN